MTRYTKNLDLAPEMLSNSFHWSEKKKGIFHIMPNDICCSLQRFLAIALKLPDTLAWMG